MFEISSANISFSSLLVNSLIIQLIDLLSSLLDRLSSLAMLSCRCCEPNRILLLRLLITARFFQTNSSQADSWMARLSTRIFKLTVLSNNTGRTNLFFHVLSIQSNWVASLYWRGSSSDTDIIFVRIITNKPYPTLFL
jgi:hypothetical protein